MTLARYREPRTVFWALPFQLRERQGAYKRALMLAEDRFGIEIKHGDHTTNAEQILGRIEDLMLSCRVSMFDISDLNPNVLFELGLAMGLKVQHRYALRKSSLFGASPLPAMIANVDVQVYASSGQLERLVDLTMSRHFWPTDVAFTAHHLGWLADQIKDLTFPGCETDKYELAEATGIDASFVTQAVNQYFVAKGTAFPVNVGPAPTYRFDYRSVRAIPAPGSVRTPLLG